MTAEKGVIFAVCLCIKLQCCVMKITECGIIMICSGCVGVIAENLYHLVFAIVLTLLRHYDGRTSLVKI